MRLQGEARHGWARPVRGCDERLLAKNHVHDAAAYEEDPGDGQDEEDGEDKPPGLHLPRGGERGPGPTIVASACAALLATAARLGIGAARARARGACRFVAAALSTREWLHTLICDDGIDAGDTLLADTHQLAVRSGSAVLAFLGVVVASVKLAELIFAVPGQAVEDSFLEGPLEEVVDVLHLAERVFLRKSAAARAQGPSGVLGRGGGAILDLAIDVVLAGLQLVRRSHEVEHVLEGRGHAPGLGPPRRANALLRAEGCAPVVGEHELEEPQGVHELQDVRQEDADPAADHGGHREVDLEVQGHADRSWQPSEWPQPLAVREHLVLGAPLDDVEAQEQRVEDHEDEARGVGHPEGAQLDVDVAQTVVAQRVDKRQNAKEDGNPRVDVVLEPLLLHLRVEPEVLRRGVPRQHGCVARDGAGPVRLELLADPSRRPRCAPARGC
mmetsp:Transcript_50278/g.139601  ORF Transcript_50278/g.139601 Transcript_50278/m.139601 type:complete len:443 (+) Transcript_50278:1268-2596(+)